MYKCLLCVVVKPSLFKSWCQVDINFAIISKQNPPSSLPPILYPFPFYQKNFGKPSKWMLFFWIIWWFFSDTWLTFPFSQRVGVIENHVDLLTYWAMFFIQSNKNTAGHTGHTKKVLLVYNTSLVFYYYPTFLITWNLSHM